MKRMLGLLTLIGFLLYTGICIFIYLFRAFQLPEPIDGETIQIWHGDPFARAILVAVFFMIGLLVLMFVALNRPGSQRTGSVRIRPDLWLWPVRHDEQTNEPPDQVAERAVAAYRARIERTGLMAGQDEH